MKENDNVKIKHTNNKSLFVRVVAIICAILIAGSAIGVALSMLY